MYYALSHVCWVKRTYQGTKSKYKYGSGSIQKRGKNTFRLRYYAEKQRNEKALLPA